MKKLVAALFWATVPAAATVVRVTETLPAVNTTFAASISAALVQPAILSLSPVLTAAPAVVPTAAAAPFPAGQGPTSAAPDDGRYDVVLDLDATIIGKVPEGESARGIDVDAADSVTVDYQDWNGLPQTRRYLIRGGFADFLRRARKDPRVGGIHIVSGSNQSRLNALAGAIRVDGRPLSQWVDSLIGGEFLHSYSPQEVPDERLRPIKDIALLGLKNLRGIDAALRRGDVAAALAMPRDLVTPRERLLAERRFLVVDDSPDMVRGGARTELAVMTPFRPAENFVPKQADEAQRQRVLALRHALWARQHGEFGRLADLIGRGLLPATPDWGSAAASPGVPGLEAASAPSKNSAN